MATGSPLGRLFGRSPIAPLQEHMRLAEKGVKMLCDLRVAAAAGAPQQQREHMHAQLQQHAGAARQLHRDLRQQLPRGLLLAVPRPDLLTLLDQQQQIVHASRHTADALALRTTGVPEALRDAMDALGAAVLGSAGQALTAIRELDEMIEQGFGDHERHHVARLLDTLDQQQAAGRSSYHRLLRAVADHEDALASPLDGLFLYRISDGLNAVLEACGGVGEQLRLLLAD